MTAIPILNANDKPADIAAELQSTGAIVLKSLSDPEQRQAIASELEPFLAETEVNTVVSEQEFYPGHTKRLIGLIRKSETVRNLVMHPGVLDLCDRILKPNCQRYQLHVASALVIGPGARIQVLHREDDSYRYFKVPRPDLIIASMWAMTDFTRENGATQIVPGSHLWEAGREAEPDEVLAAEMKTGDTLLWMGGVLHGAGANTSNDWRYGIFLSYSLGWLRQEENQYLAVPPELARALPREIRELVGYKMHEGLGVSERDIHPG